MKLRTVSRLIIGGVVAGGIGVAAWQGFAPKAVTATPTLMDVSAVLHRPAPSFMLRDQSGRRVSLRSFRGNEVILTFMYTHCPDTCPLTAQKLRMILHSFGSEARRVAVVIVSTDPFGDSRTTARAFLRRNGDPAWHFLLGSYLDLAPVWKSFAIYAGVSSRQASKAPTHSALMYMISPSGEEQAIIEDLQPAFVIQHDLHVFLNDGRRLTTIPVAPTVGSRAPAFALPALRGGMLSLTELAGGKPLLVNFWATYCGPCTKEMPLLERAYRQYRGRLQIVGIDEEEPASEASAYVSSHHATYPIVLDGSGNVQYDYALLGTPTTFFIDRSGIIRDINVGAVTPGSLRSGIRLAQTG